MRKFFNRQRALRWLREGVNLLVIGAAIVWAVDFAALSEQKPLLVYVWATWCNVCRFTSPSVNKLAEQGGNVVSIAMRSGDDRRLAQWMHKKDLTMPVINDPRGELVQRWQVSVTPTLVVIDKGQPVSATTGWTSYWGMKLRLWWAGITA